MVALTFYRPWLEAVLAGVKRIENRPWPCPRTHIGTVIALHAGQKYDADGAAFIEKQGYALKPRAQSNDTAQHIVGVARVLCVVQHPRFVAQPLAPPIVSNPVGVCRETLNEVMKSAWFFGPYGWVLDEIRALSQPVRCPGAQGLWSLPDDVERNVREQIGVG